MIPVLYAKTARDGPVLHNEWQSWYFSCIRDHKLVEDGGEPGETQADRQKRMFAAYEEMHENLHGPSYKIRAAQESVARREAIEAEKGEEERATGFSLPPDRMQALVDRQRLGQPSEAVVSTES